MDQICEVEGFTYFDYADNPYNPDNRKSTSYVFIYGCGAISCPRSKLHECTTLSTIEAKYVAASEATKEAIWLHQLSAYFSAKGRIAHPTPTLYCDSQSAIHLIKNHVYNTKTKHIEVRYHIQELITDKKLDVWKVDTELNIADSLTKPLSDHHFGTLRRQIGLLQSEEQRRAKLELEHDRRVKESES